MPVISKINVLAQKNKMADQYETSRWGFWLVCILSMLWSGWSLLIKTYHDEASIVVYSVVDRPINYIYINGNIGNNASAFDGVSARAGGSTGPYRLEGDIVKIDWLLSVDMEQQEGQVYRSEPHTISLPMPKRKKGQNDLCVLFLPNNKPMVRWANSCAIEMADSIDPYRVGLTARGD
ncbi:hypothetical protein D3C72_1065400 [compost metagenome]